MDSGVKEEHICEVCDDDKVSSGYSSNLKKHLCQECWDDYGEACYYGLA
jgi:hypothetical protein